MKNRGLEEEFEKATDLRDAGDLAAARLIMENLSQRFPSIFAVWLVLGGIQMTLADYPAAEVSFTMAITLRPRSELASLSMFHTLKHLGRVDDAFVEMRRFLALRPESHEYERLRSELDDTK